MSKKNNNYKEQVEDLVVENVLDDEVEVVEEEPVEVVEEEPIEIIEAEPVTVEIVKTDYRLNVRADKSLNSAVVKIFEPGSEFVLDKIDGEWGKLKDEDAWVMLKFTSF